jgi:hypothetical protein
VAEGHWHQVGKNMGVIGGTECCAVHAEGAEDVGLAVGFKGLVR